MERHRPKEVSGRHPLDLLQLHLHERVLALINHPHSGGRLFTTINTRTFWLLSGPNTYTRRWERLKSARARFSSSLGLSLNLSPSLQN